MLAPMMRPDSPRALFIVGSPRSGTSVFFKTLSAHPAFATTTNLTRRFRSRFVPVRIAELLGARHRPVEATSMWQAFWPAAERVARAEDCTEHDRAVLRRVLYGHTRHFGRPVFLAKNPGLTLRIRWLAEGMPEARFIHLVRDGRAAAASILRICRAKGKHWSIKRAWPELKGMDYASYSGALWSRLAVAGDESIAALPAERALTVRYEQFVREPHATFRRAAALAGVDWGAEGDALVPEIRNHNGAWDDQFSDDDRARILEHALPGLRHFGYPTDSVWPEGAPGASASAGRSR
jgi:hypothetical protein